jgi:hypothetical protein
LGVSEGDRSATGRAAGSHLWPTRPLPGSARGLRRTFRERRRPTPASSGNLDR